MKTYLTSLLAVGLIGLTACGPTVNTYKTADADLGKYQSFAFLPNADIRMPADNSLKSDEVNQFVVSTLNDNMRQQGYTLDRDNPDLLVLLSVSSEERTDVTQDPIYANAPLYATYPYTGTYAGYTTISPFYNNYYYNGYTTYNQIVGYDTDVTRYKEGTLVVDVVDRATKETLWKGVSSTSIYGGRNTEALRTMINEIFEDFPKTDKVASR